MVVKEFRELRRDRRTVAMLVALPLLLLVVFGYAANFQVDHLDAIVVGPAAQQVAAQLPATVSAVDVDPSADEQDAEEMLRDGDADLAIVAQPGNPVALVDGSSLFTAQAAVAALSQAPIAVQTDVLFNPDLETSWVMVPALVGLIMAFIGMIITSLGLVRERQAGTLEQLAVMPFRPSDVILGKIAPYFVLALVDLVVITVLGVVLFGVPFAGSVVVFGAGAVLFLLVVLGLGVLISTVSQNQGQAIQTAMMVLLPQILLSGMIFPLASMPWGVRWIGYLLPLTYFIRISQGVMLRAAPFSSLWIDFVVLAVMATVALGLAVLRFRRDLAPESGSARDAAESTDPVLGTAA
jgi:ABC-2 type transport system permease protein